ncbi:hypothetical protein CsSME_00028978 [Camellia sinensis var. sinensis]
MDDVDVTAKKKSGFNINNRHVVWKMITATEKKKITDAYNRDGDSAVMWDGHGHGVAVYFTDVKSLVRQSEIRGNERINEGVDAADKSYFFSSICLDMMKNNNVRSRNRYVLDNLHAAKLFRYKNIVSEVQRQTMGNDSIDTQEYDPPVESVVDCPQQRPELLLDCAIIVCAVMRQHVRHVDVKRSLHGGNFSVLWAIMVKSFVNDPLRGLKNDLD